jgi:nucleoside-diphosphate-sugar epimerase
MEQKKQISPEGFKKHTILGAGGSVGNCLAEELLKQHKTVRLVSRSGYEMTGAGSVKADLTSFPDVLKSVKGSDVVYLCAGLPYRYDIWKEQWPRIMDYVTEACIKENALLIFFDNVYMYGAVEGKMTEESPYNPRSKKGEVRARIAQQLEEEMAKRNIRAIIARAADLYGPYAVQTSMLWQLIIRNLRRGKRAQWMGSLMQPHTFTYTRDCAKAMVLLAETPEARGDIWHLPTSNPGLTAQQWTQLFAEELGENPRCILIPKWALRLYGYVDKTVEELYEMLYQQELAYHFDSTKFEKAFNFSPTPYEQGVKETLAFLDKH